MKYIYNGPVMYFNTLILNNWKGETIAESESKARNNLAYQFKKHTNRIGRTKITLPGKLTVIE